MRGKFFVLGLILLAIALSTSFEASRRLMRIERSYNAASEGDVLFDACRLPPRTYGRIFRQSSGGTLLPSEVETFARETAERKKQGRAWVAAFMSGYNDPIRSEE